MTSAEYYKGIPVLIRAAIIASAGLLLVAYVVAIAFAVDFMRVDCPFSRTIAVVIFILVAVSMVHDRRKWAKSEAKMRELQFHDIRPDKRGH